MRYIRRGDAIDGFRHPSPAGQPVRYKECADLERQQKRHYYRVNRPRASMAFAPVSNNASLSAEPFDRDHGNCTDAGFVRLRQWGLMHLNTMLRDTEQSTKLAIDAIVEIHGN